MPQYDYRCNVCKKEFSIEKTMSEHKNPEDCDYCYAKECASQVFTTDYQPSTKVWDNSILKQITFDRE